MSTKDLTESVPAVTAEDWHHISDTVAMLSLAVAQIELALTDGSEEANQIGSAFDGIANASNSILDASNTKDNAGQCENCQKILTHLNEAVVAFQFYDRVSQRLDHVAVGLRKLTRLMADADAIAVEQNWLDVQEEIKASYTMESERVMFEQIMRGIDIDEALQTYRHQFTASTEEDDNSDDDIELF